MCYKLATIPEQGSHTLNLSAPIQSQLLTSAAPLGVSAAIRYRAIWLRALRAVGFTGGTVSAHAFMQGVEQNGGREGF
jgi:hypothetical protein